MTLGMVLGVAIGAMVSYRILTIGLRIWRASAQAEAEAERKRLDRIIRASEAPPRAAGLRHDSRRVGR